MRARHRLRTHSRAVCGLLVHDARLCIARIAALKIGPLMRDAAASSRTAPIRRDRSLVPGHRVVP